MNITFNKAEVLAALTTHVAATGISLRGKEVSIVDDGEFSIEVSIDEIATTKPKAKRARKASKTAVVNTPEEEVVEVSPEAQAEDEAADAEEDADSVIAAMEGKTEKPKAKAKTAAKKKTAGKKRLFGTAK